jgi:hypothetical protein
MVLTSNGKVCTWGYNGFYQLGDRTSMNRYTPAVVNVGGYSVLSIAIVHRLMPDSHDEERMFTLIPACKCYFDILHFRNSQLKMTNKRPSSSIYPGDVIFTLHDSFDFNITTLAQEFSGAICMVLRAIDLNWDNEKMANSKNIVLTNNKSVKYEGIGGFATIATKEIISRGRHYFELKISGPVSEENAVLVGVIDDKYLSTPTVPSYLSGEHAWACFLADGKLYHIKQDIDYCRDTITVPTTVGMLLDMEKAELTYIINGINYGVAFRDVVGIVSIAVSIIYNNTVEIQNVDPHKWRNIVLFT